MNRYSPMDYEAAEALLLLSRAPIVHGVNSNSGTRAIRQEGLVSQSGRVYLGNPGKEQRAQTYPAVNVITAQDIHPPQPIPPAEVGRKPNTMTPDQALQAYLIRQQFLAGIAPQDMIPMRGHRAGQPQRRVPGVVSNASIPPVVQITNNGIAAPYIPPARFNGVIHPFPVLHERTRPMQENAPRQMPDTSDRPDTGTAAQQAPILPVEPNRPSDARNRNQQARRLVRPRRQRVVNDAQVSRNKVSSREERGVFSQLHRVRAHFQQSLNGLPHTTPGNPPSQEAPPGNETRCQEENPNQNPSHNGFDILKAFSDRLELSFMLIDYLGPLDLMNLYTASRPLHYFIKSHMRRIILCQAAQNAPEAALAFPFRCYPKQCVRSLKRSLVIGPKEENKMRYVLIPSFQWLFMIIHRETIIESIIQWMERIGHGLPKQSASALRRLWFLMDIPDNKRRTWTVQNPRLWDGLNLFLAAFFMIQLDILMQDRDENRIGGGLRRLMMAHPSLEFVWDVLSGAALETEHETLQSFVRWRYKPRPHEVGRYVYGVPPEEVGLLHYEGYGRHGKRMKLYRPDHLLLKEMKRRKIDVRQIYKDVFLLDEVEEYTNKDTMAWDEALRDETEGTESEWLNAVNLDRLGA
ncbi:hypothetical protein EYZ11_003655 [Aspergillus tanneri]|uniref:Uncharacterized protein n=1 Tax=Aspergillus tanneri TaxID=1220188 RepID=A0A4S3JMZ4_9EURO|nr:uncharacterized protein ATNIH1004_009791 [Aspergillus tanneri]KAA8643029.1 hypothetical protein ATNIH1004_009791 [Aspergillus tanneri]THC96885.1 hypothetical protein EYZ11_003655 [Aspergillus tanneri]